MYIFDIDGETKTTPKTDDKYNSYESLDTLIKEMKTDREDVNINAPPPIIDDTEQPPEIIPDVIPIAEIKPNIDIPRPPPVPERLRRFESMFVAKNMSKFGAISCSFISDEDLERFLLDDFDLKELADYVYEWRKLSNEVLPPWLQFLIGACLIFFPKFKEAFGIRKEKKKIMQLEAKQAEMEKQINDFQLQARANEIERQELELKNINLQSKIKPDPKLVIIKDNDSQT